MFFASTFSSRGFRVNVSIRQTDRRVNKLQVSPVVIRNCCRGLRQFDMTAFRELCAILVGGDLYLTRKQGRKPKTIQEPGAGLVADSAAILHRQAFQGDLINVGSNRAEFRLKNSKCSSTVSDSPPAHPAKSRRSYPYTRGRLHRRGGP